jgi:hypothetical protein
MSESDENSQPTGMSDPSSTESSDPRRHHEGGVPCASSLIVSIDLFVFGWELLL